MNLRDILQVVKKLKEKLNGEKKYTNALSSNLRIQV